METSVSSTQLDLLPMESESTSSSADSRVKTFPSLVKALALQARGPDSGVNSIVLFAKFDLATSSWRTSQVCLVEDLERFSETWPRSGMTRNGSAFPLPLSAPLTEEIESGLLPTPGATEGGPMPPDTDYRPHKRSYNSRTGKHVQITTRRWVEMWRTPDASIVSGGAANAEDRKRQGHAIGLHDQVATPSMWPTPHGFSKDGGKSNGPSGNELGNAVNRAMMPTPDANCWKGGAENQRKGQLNGSLNPTWVEWLMGFPLDWTSIPGFKSRTSRGSRKASRTESTD